MEREPEVMLIAVSSYQKITLKEGGKLMYLKPDRWLVFRIGSCDI